MILKYVLWTFSKPEIDGKTSITGVLENVYNEKTMKPSKTGTVKTSITDVLSIRFPHTSKRL